MNKLTAIEHPAVEDLVLKESRPGKAVTLIPWSMSASVTLKSVGSKVLSCAEAKAAKPRARGMVNKDKCILGGEKENRKERPNSKKKSPKAKKANKERRETLDSRGRNSQRGESRQREQKK